MAAHLCPTSIIMAALTVGIIISDMWFLHGERVITHLFLGGITTGLFYVLCQHEYELINWIFLAIVPIYILISITTTTVKSRIHESDERDEDEDDYRPCGGCGEPRRSCSCEKPKPVPRSCGGSVTNACVGASVNMEDPTPMTKE
jgi:hypothetical protein